MTTPRVTVPVEPTVRMLSAGAAHMRDDALYTPNSVWSAMLSAAPAPEGGAVEATGAKAVIRNDQIVISIDVDALPLILSGSIALNAVAGTFKVTDASTFANEVCHALNAEKEDGTTRVHMMFDSAFDHAIDQGAEGVEEISEDEFEAEAARLQAEAKSALATREEAPAEAGEDIQKRVERVVFEDFYGSPLAGSKERLAKALIREFGLSALRARPQAREDARPVEWRRLAQQQPKPGHKIVTLHDDGSGAALLFVYDGGVIDSDGDDYTKIGSPQTWWTYLPDGFEFWCEGISEDPVTLPEHRKPDHPAPGSVRAVAAALKPFAMAARGLSSRWADHETHWQEATSPVAVEDLRRADQALASLQAEQKGGA